MNFIKGIIYSIKDFFEQRKKLKNMKKQDPFIY